MSNGGWIKLHRKIIDNWIWDDPEKLRAWLDILLMVNHEDKQIPFNGHIKTIHRGEKLTSLAKLAERWKWTRNRVSRFIDLLCEADMVTADRTANGTLLTVVNYGIYQSVRYTSEAGNEAADEAASEATGEAQTRTIKNYKNDKREGQAPHSFSPPTIEEVRDYCLEKHHSIDPELFISYYDMRDWELSKGKKMSNWKSAVNAWARRERTSASADGITDKQAKVSYERTMQRIADMKKDAEASKRYDPSEILNKARLKLAGGEA